MRELARSLDDIRVESLIIDGQLFLKSKTAKLWSVLDFITTDNDDDERGLDWTTYDDDDNYDRHKTAIGYDFIAIRIAVQWSSLSDAGMSRSVRSRKGSNQITAEVGRIKRYWNGTDRSTDRLWWTAKLKYSSYYCTCAVLYNRLRIFPIALYSDIQQASLRNFLVSSPTLYIDRTRVSCIEWLWFNVLHNINIYSDVAWQICETWRPFLKKIVWQYTELNVCQIFSKLAHIWLSYEINSNGSLFSEHSVTTALISFVVFMDSCILHNWHGTPNALVLGGIF